MRLSFEALLAEKYFNRSIHESAKELVNEALADVIDKVKKTQLIRDKILKEKIVEKLGNMELLVMFPDEILNRTKVIEVYKELGIDGSESFVKMYLAIKKHNRKLFIEESMNRMKILDKIMKEFHMKYFIEENILSTQYNNFHFTLNYHFLFLRYSSYVHIVSFLLSKPFKVFQYSYSVFRSSASTQ